MKKHKDLLWPLWPLWPTPKEEFVYMYGEEEETIHEEEEEIVIDYSGLPPTTGSHKKVFSMPDEYFEPDIPDLFQGSE